MMSSVRPSLKYSCSGIAAQVLEGQNGDDGACGQGEQGVFFGGGLSGGLRASADEETKTREDDSPRGPAMAHDRTDPRLVLTQPGEDAGKNVHALRSRPRHSGSPALRRPSM